MTPTVALTRVLLWHAPRRNHHSHCISFVVRRDVLCTMLLHGGGGGGGVTFKEYMTCVNPANLWSSTTLKPKRK